VVDGFHSDTLADGRGIRTLKIVEDFTRECRAIEVDVPPERCYALMTDYERVPS